VFAFPGVVSVQTRLTLPSASTFNIGSDESPALAEIFCEPENVPAMERAKKTSFLGSAGVFACQTTSTLPLASTPTCGLLAFPVPDMVFAPEKPALPLFKRLYMITKLPGPSSIQTTVTFPLPSTATCAPVELPTLLETAIGSDGNDCPLSVERLKEI